MKNLTKSILIIFLLWTVVCGLSTASADIPHLINYQGKLTDKDGNPVPDISHSVVFSIYDVESSGSPLWQETQSVKTTKGIFSVLLGGATTGGLNLAFDKPYWLEIKVGNEVMSPRQRMASVGYAIRAEKANLAETAVQAQNANSLVGKNLNSLQPLLAMFTPTEETTDYTGGWLDTDCFINSVVFPETGIYCFIYSLDLRDAGSATPHARLLVGTNQIVQIDGTHGDYRTYSGVRTANIPAGTYTVKWQMWSGNGGAHRLYIKNKGAIILPIPQYGK